VARDSIRVEGVRELTRSIAAADKGLAKELANANRDIGQKIISRIFPRPRTVGAGRGAEPRAVASRNYVAIQAGRADRRHHVQQWGARYVRREGKRPYILGTALREFPNLEREYLDGIERVLRSISDQ